MPIRFTHALHMNSRQVEYQRQGVTLEVGHVIKVHCTVFMEM